MKTKYIVHKMWISAVICGLILSSVAGLWMPFVHAHHTPWPSRNISHWECGDKDVVQCNTEQLLLNRSLDQALGYLLHWEVGILINDPGWGIVLEGFTRRFNQYCHPGDPLSRRCVRGFWAYFSPMYVMQYRADYLQQMSEGIDHKWYYWGMTARSNRSTGGKEDDRPFDWFTLSYRYNPVTLDKWLKKRPDVVFHRVYNTNGVITMFVVMTPNQVRALCQSACVNLP